jgi:hypothetical protein
MVNNNMTQLKHMCYIAYEFYFEYIKKDRS